MRASLRSAGQYCIFPSRPMKVLVVGLLPLPFTIYRILKSKYLVDVISLKKDFIASLSSHQYELILIWSEGLPLLFAKNIVRHALVRFPSLKILIFSASYSSAQRAELLLAGAKDCLAAGVSSAELLAKITLLAGKTQVNQFPPAFIRGEFAFDFTQNIASYRGVAIPLNKKEALVLSAVLKRSSTIISKQALYDSIWDSNTQPASNSLEVYVSSLRRKIEKPFGLKLLENVKSVGYRVKNS